MTMEYLNRTRDDQVHGITEYSVVRTRTVQVQMRMESVEISRMRTEFASLLLARSHAHTIIC